METTLYNQHGKKAGTLTLPEGVFGVAWNNDLVQQVVTAMQANARTPVAHTKNRAEVSGTGKKPWRQKGTGSARHGSRRSPIWRTGGVAHGPRNERDFSQRINKKMRAKALFAVLSKKYADGEVLFVDALTFEAPKTKDAKAALVALAGIKGYETLATKRRNAALVATVGVNDAVTKSFNNFGSIELEEVRNLNPVEVLRHKFIVIAGGDEALKVLAARSGAGASKKV
jgi:large subunit ribosomal protein L4